ncbi:glycosyltransferase [Candidatus Omnitrophota bacterium]
MDIPKVAVIIPAKGRAPHLKKCLASVLGLNYPYFDTIVVDDGLDENAKRDIDAYAEQVKVLSSSQQGPSFARNVAAHFTDAEFLAFTDSDCLVDRDWLNQMLKGFQYGPETAACGGVQRLPPEASRFEAHVFSFMRKIGFLTDYIRSAAEDKIIAVAHNASCNVMYRRDIFLKENGFLQGLWPGEDVEFDHRLTRNGHTVVFNPHALVEHHRPDSLPGFCRMMYRYGKAQGFLVRRYGIFRKIQLVPLAGFLIILFFLGLGIFSPTALTPALVVMVAVCLVYFRGFLLLGLFIFAGFCWHAGFCFGLGSGFSKSKR